MCLFFTIQITLGHAIHYLFDLTQFIIYHAMYISTRYFMTRGDRECVFVLKRTDTTNLEDFFSNCSIQMYSFGLVAEIVFAENPHNTNLVVHTAKKNKKIELSKTTNMSRIPC